MSAALKLRNKENIEAPKPAPADNRLERLYTEQLARTREAQHEQERLELELLAHEKQLLEAQTALKRSSEVNKRLVGKLQAETEFVEQELGHYKERAAVLAKELDNAKVESAQMKLLLRQKDDEMISLNQELEEVLLELEGHRSKPCSSPVSADDESVDMASFGSTGSRRGNDYEATDDEEGEDDEPNTHDILFDDEELGQLSDEDEDDQHLVMDSMNLTGELNMKLGEKNAQLKRLHFEIESLKKEKSQLYTYVNKLLKNKPSPDQNEVLKQKLVRRKILRAVSINAVLDDSQPAKASSMKNRYNSKRIVSNYVDLKSYKYDPHLKPRSRLQFIDTMVTNSDDEEESDELESERALLGFNFIGSGFLMEKTLPTGVTPLHTLLKSVEQTTHEIDLTVD